MSVILEVSDLWVRYRLQGLALSRLLGRGPRPLDAVTGVSFALKEGETLAVVGESGSGKSTLARALIGLLPAAAGSIRFEGRELARADERVFNSARRQMAMMFQDPVASLSPRLRVAALVAEPFAIHEIDPPGGSDAAVERLLGLVGLPAGFASRYPRQLSGGQARRVGVARALALSPRVVIADEPTAGLDVSVQGTILNLLARLQSELGLTYLLISHNLPVVRHVSDRVAVMYMGQIIEDGPTTDVFGRPAHPYTRMLLSAQPARDPEARRTQRLVRGDVPSLLDRPAGCTFHTRCPIAQDVCRRTAPPRTTEASRGFRCHYPQHRNGAIAPAFSPATGAHDQGIRA